MRKRLTLAAIGEVRAVILQLPPQVRILANSLPVFFEMTPRPFEVKTGVEPETLGLFAGDSYSESAEPTGSEPAQVILFIENIWHYARHDSAEFKEEIRRTYLHELGHYLGLDEDDLALRGLAE